MTRQVMMRSTQKIEGLSCTFHVYVVFGATTYHEGFVSYGTEWNGYSAQVNGVLIVVVVVPAVRSAFSPLLASDLSQHAGTVGNLLPNQQASR